MPKPITGPLRKAVLAVQGEAGLVKFDVIEANGEFWLVPAWLEKPGGRRRQPERIIQLKWLVPDPPTLLDQDFVLPYPLPRAVLSGRLPHAEGPLYVVVGMPDLFLDVPPAPKGY